MKKSFYDDVVLKIPPEKTWRVRLIVDDVNTGEQWVSGLAYSKEEWEQLNLCNEAIVLAKDIFKD